MKYVLVPTLMPDKVTLYEALAWVAFNFYPTVEYFSARERREDLRLIV